MSPERTATVGPVETFAVPSLADAYKSARADVFADARSDGYADGFAAGHLEGLTCARAEVDAALAAQRTAEAEHAAATQLMHAEIARLAAAATALEQAAADLRARDTVAVADVETAVVELAVELTEATLQRELSAPESAFDALRRAAALTPDRGQPVVRVHPDVVAAVDARLAGPDVAAALRGADVVGDPGIDLHGCVVEVGDCRIDAQISTAVARLRAALNGTGDRR